MVCAWVFICVISGLAFECFIRIRSGAQHHVPGECLALGCVEWIPASECQTRRLPVRMSGVLSVLSLPHLTLNNSSLGVETNQGLKTIWSLWMGFGGCEHQGIMCTSVVWTGVWLSTDSQKWGKRTLKVMITVILDDRQGLWNTQ